MTRPNQFLSPEGDLEDYFVDEYWLIDQWVGDTLWTWGRNTNGRLGDNTTTQRNTPVTTFAGGTNWEQVSSGNNYSAAIKTDGTLWTWGANNFLQLGASLASTANRSTPITTSAGGTNWKQLDCGQFHAGAVKTDGTLWLWGLGTSGQLGRNSTSNGLVPQETILGGTNWKQVSCGDGTSAAIKTDGSLWVWGFNLGLQLGVNDRILRSTPVTTFAGGNNWKQVSMGSIGTAIKTDGTLWVWGGNNVMLGTNSGGNASTPVTTFAGGTNWKQVSCSTSMVAAIKTDGSLWVWGYNSDGQLGTNNTSGSLTPVTTFAGGTNWKSVQCDGADTGSFNGVTLAIKTDGTLWTWGRNSYGQLGDNTTTNRLTPVTTFVGGTNWKQSSAGYFHTLAVTSGTDPTFFIA